VTASPYYADDRATLLLGDCLDVLADLPDASVDSIVTDPPYGLGFMGKEWDSAGAFVERKAAKSNTFDHVGGNHNPSNPADGARTRRAEGVRFSRWCEQWAAECLRVLKPGGHLVAFGGTRTYHRLACAIEDAGFEVRDSLHWVYGSGFPKGQNIGRAIDRRRDDRPHILTGTYDLTSPATEAARSWAGWHTQLKPAHEPIILARKTTGIHSTVANVLLHGTGALNIDDCRTAPTGENRLRVNEASQDRRYANEGGTNFAALPGVRGGDPTGRWPANLLLGHGPDCVDGGNCQPGCPVAEMDQQSGVLRSGANPARRSSDKFRDTYGVFPGQAECAPARGADAGSASRFFPVFRYAAKAPAAERPRLPDGTAHPTVKPLSLMRWLVRLVTPPGGLVLDPFAGTGTTLEAAAAEGFLALGIERHRPYADLSVARLSKPSATPLFGAAP
jgi:DNA modification methylase